MQALGLGRDDRVEQRLRDGDRNVGPDVRRRGLGNGEKGVGRRGDGSVIDVPKEDADIVGAKEPSDGSKAESSADEDDMTRALVVGAAVDSGWSPWENR